MQRKRLDNRTHKIWRFNPWHDKMTDLERWKRAKKFNHFQKRIIDKFCEIDVEEIIKRFGICGKETYFNHQYPTLPIINHLEIGLDMLKEKGMIVTENQWNYWYLAVPYQQRELIKYINRIIPKDFTEEKKMMP